MTCFRYSDIESSLRPCGLRCNDFKRFLIATGGADEKSLLQAIFDRLYFGDIPEGDWEKKCSVWVEKNIFTDPIIQLYVHLEGHDNLFIQQLLIQSKHFLEDSGFVSSQFGRMEIYLVPYNKCFCDYCIRKCLDTIDLKIRVIVFKDFFIPIDEVSLMGSAIRSLIPPLECCQPNPLRDDFLWLGDGIDPISSICKLSNSKYSIQNFTTFIGIVSHAQRNPCEKRMTRSRKPLADSQTWGELALHTPYLLMGVYDHQLYLFTLGAFMVQVRDYPAIIEEIFNPSEELVFICKYHDLRFTMRTFDRDYQEEGVPIWG